MTSKDNVDAQNSGARPAVVDEVADVKPKTGTAPARLVMTAGNVREIESAGDIISHVNAGNIVIDPALAEKAAKKHAGPPMTIAEAFERGDFLAAARMIEAQIARAQNGDFEGGRYEDLSRYAADKEKAYREREAELRQYYDANGGYHDRYGGYFNPNQGTYTDANGGVIDNYGGYTYKDGSYKGKFGDYYDRSSNTIYMANGEEVKVEKGTPPEKVRKGMQELSGKYGGHDPNFISKAELGTAADEHRIPGKDVSPEAHSAAEHMRATSANAQTRGPDHNAPHVTTAGDLGAILGRAGIKSEIVPKTSESKFSPNAKPSIGTGDATSSSFFPVDSSPSTSKFGITPTETPPDKPNLSGAAVTRIPPKSPSL
jgi:hypothetical protein